MPFSSVNVSEGELEDDPSTRSLLSVRREFMSVFSELESFLFHQGTNYSVYKKMGAHVVTENGVKGVRFVVWAPNAQDVSVVCGVADQEKEHHMERGYDGIWERFVPHVKSGDSYRYAITGADGVKRLKSDPYSFLYELRPDNASVVCSLSEARSRS